MALGQRASLRHHLIVPAQNLGAFVAANFEMPLQLLRSLMGGVILEIAYQPLVIPFLRQGRNLKLQTSQAWVTGDGPEMLPEQGIAQFELLTGGIGIKVGNAA
jgi:shikimate 5-dehydrogenase